MVCVQTEPQCTVTHTHTPQLTQVELCHMRLGCGVGNAEDSHKKVLPGVLPDPPTLLTSLWGPWWPLVHAQVLEVVLAGLLSFILGNGESSPGREGTCCQSVLRTCLPGTR